METFQLRIFQDLLLDQCKFVVRAAHEINSALQSNDLDHVFYGIQNILNASANISKILWGQKGKLADERKRIRESIGVSDDSPIKDVVMRNNFEHMDERIDRWWNKSTAHNHIAKMIGPRDTIEGFEEIDVFRWFDPTTTDVIFWGNSCNIQKILNEVEDFIPKLQAEVSKPHWDRDDQ